MTLGVRRSQGSLSDTLQFVVAYAEFNFPDASSLNLAYATTNKVCRTSTAFRRSPRLAHRSHLMTQPLIVIVGFMGSGKSTVARALAARLNSRMLDLDEEIAKLERRSAKEIIESDGEAAFREIETRTLRDTLRNDPARVVSLGGGAWISERNRELIAESAATSVWLDAPFSLCWKRIVTTGSERPLSKTEPEAKALYETRRATYRLADLHIETIETKSADEIALEIIQALAGRSR